MAKNKKFFYKKIDPAKPNLLRQKFLMKKNAPEFTEKKLLNKNEVIWEGKVRPTSDSCEYFISIKLSKGSNRVKVTLLNPGLECRDGSKPPHLHHDDTLCLHLPLEWNYRMSVIKIIPWISLWLYYYEIWHITGQWLGGGHGEPKPI